MLARTLADSDAPPGDPLDTFVKWYAEAERAGAPFVDAFAFATANADGRPSVRYVLFKGVVEGTLRFVTNFESNKARDLEGNPRAAIAFFWPATGRQVRMEGVVERAPEADSDRYFARRDRATQLGAWASAWTSRESRLHDRFRYERAGEGWTVERLAP